MQPAIKKRKRRKIPTRIVHVPDLSTSQLNQLEIDNNRIDVEDWERRMMENQEVKARFMEENILKVVLEFKQKVLIHHPDKRYSLEEQIGWWNTEQIADTVDSLKGETPLILRCGNVTLFRASVIEDSLTLAVAIRDTNILTFRQPNVYRSGSPFYVSLLTVGMGCVVKVKHQRRVDDDGDRATDNTLICELAPNSVYKHKVTEALKPTVSQ